ncbi:MAG: hypothetical protein SFV24_24350 [Gemmatimonadales bacterium]|nr:hypothetical protein [Gemmatimonadales bacterium]
MLPDPLHPAIVHFPIVLAVLLPVAAIGALFLIRRGTVTPRLGWGVVTLLALGLFGSSWLAVETGEQQEERVEQAVPERIIESHGERAERFLVLTGATLALAGLGLARGRVGEMGRAVATVATLALLPAGYQVGHSGGELVYRHGAAQVHVAAAATPGTEGGGVEARSDDGDDDDR